MSVEKARWMFNVSDYYRMAEAGMFAEGDRVELIEGEILKMSPTGSRHAACVDRLNAALSRLLGGAAIVRVQSPVHLNDFSEPLPDIALLKNRSDFYEQSHPTPDDVLLIIEVADSSVVYDRAVKVPLYARAGVPEVWLVDLVKNEVEVCSRPESGAYAETRRVRRGEPLASAQLPSLALGADDVLA
ncbi:MAG TPA: Uma2 family endonuclease [Pyrinomonadaceae bacterium]|nr:Uma2 family endonuclease [Pyrinomonadaceae bacterium]